MKNRIDLYLGKVVFISFIYRISDSELNLLNASFIEFIFHCVTLQTRNNPFYYMASSASGQDESNPAL